VDDRHEVISDCDAMIRSMDPQVVPGTYVFATVAQHESLPDGVNVFSTVWESEGLSVVVASEDANRFGLTNPVKLGWITLTVNSSLEGVGLTAAVSSVLAGHEIACNVVAGHHHDHLLVPANRVSDAIALLTELAAQR
jgi:hypothetical protein